MKIAFVGFRHAHGKMGYRRITADARYTICGVCEEDPETRAALRVDGIPVTHDSYAAMLAETSPDVVVVCDRFDLRGSRVIEALRAGCHVIAENGNIASTVAAAMPKAQSELDKLISTYMDTAE